jgi:hypothetical protein
MILRGEPEILIWGAKLYIKKMEKINKFWESILSKLVLVSVPDD